MARNIGYEVFSLVPVELECQFHPEISGHTFPYLKQKQRYKFTMPCTPNPQGCFTKFVALIIIDPGYPPSVTKSHNPLAKNDVPYLKADISTNVGDIFSNL